MSMVGLGVLAGIGACVGLGATAPVAARRVYRRVRARSAERQVSEIMALAYAPMIPVEVKTQRPSMVRVDFRQLEPHHMTRVAYEPIPDLEPVAPVPVPDPAPPQIVEVERIVYKALPEDLSTYVTIIEVMRRMGVDITNEKTWSLGRQARTLHVKQYGVPPRKVLRTKTNGTGSHDFSGYPPEFVETLEMLIKGEVA